MPPNGVEFDVVNSIRRGRIWDLQTFAGSDAVTAAGRRCRPIGRRDRARPWPGHSAAAPWRDQGPAGVEYEEPVRRRGAGWPGRGGLGEAARRLQVGAGTGSTDGGSSGAVSARRSQTTGRRFVIACRSDRAQPKAQEPGPPARPQPAQGLGAAGAASGAALPAANTDNCFSSEVDWHWGQAGTVSERTSVSKRCPQSWQAYS